MKKWIVGLVIFTAALGVAYAPVASAESVRITPLQYRAELAQGEVKKGSVDIANPSSETLELKLYVNGFSQVDDKGNLRFFEDEQIKAGLLLDYDTVTLAPYQTLRLFFIADGTKLPPGDVFGVIFAETLAANHPGTNTAVRVGTLVMLSNGTPGPRQAKISDLSTPFFQFGDTVSGTAKITNPAPRDKATGFSPEIKVAVTPWGAHTTAVGPLVFAGNSRMVDFEVPSNQFGLYTVSLQAGGDTQSARVFLVTGWWRIIVPIVLVVCIAGVVVCVKLQVWRKLRFHRFFSKSK